MASTPRERERPTNSPEEKGSGAGAPLGVGKPWVGWQRRTNRKRRFPRARAQKVSRRRQLSAQQRRRSWTSWQRALR